MVLSFSGYQEALLKEQEHKGKKIDLKNNNSEKGLKHKAIN
jgi:hypothetical protein